MQPIIALKLPVILARPIDNQLLTLYLIRSNSVNKEPYDPNYAKRTRKRSASPCDVITSKKKKKKKKSTKLSPLPKDETSRSVKPDKVKKSKSNHTTDTKKSSKSKSSSKSPTSNLKVSRKSPSKGGDRSTSQVLSVPSTSKAPSNQYKVTNKTTPPKRKHSDGHSSSSKSSTCGTSSTSKSYSTTIPKTSAKAQPSQSLSNSKKYPVICVPEPFRHFKIPKKPKNSCDDKNTIPKRLQPSVLSPVDLIIGKNNRVNQRVRQNDSTESQNCEDLDALEEAESELWDGILYGGEQEESSPSQSLDDFSSEFNEPSIKQEEDKQIDDENESNSNEWCQDDPIDQFLPPLPPVTQSLLKQLDDESESSDDECNFKRRGSCKRKKIEFEVPVKKDSKPTITSSKLSTNNQEIRQRPIPTIKSESKSKLISLRPPSLSASIPSSLSPSRQLHLSSIHPHPHPTPTSQPPTPSSPPLETVAQSIITEVLNISSTNEAMKKFITYSSNPDIFASDLQSFQTLFRTLLLNILFDADFTMNEKRFGVLLKLMQQLRMDESHHWEKIIFSWGSQYKSQFKNETKLENIIEVTKWIIQHLQSNKIPIDLSTAELLYSMNMAKNEHH